MEETWDVLVVGGGPAGMMAAGTAAVKGGSKCRVLLIEKNDSLGKKLLITGGGRCNVTNAELDTRRLLEKYRDNAKFLFSAFSQWSVAETLDFFHLRNMDTKVEKELRVFPVSDSAQSVWDVLVENLRKHGVTVLSNSPVVEIVKEKTADGREVIVGVRLANKKVVRARAIIIATGGTSRPETGSTGDGYGWLEKIGHTVVQPELVGERLLHRLLLEPRAAPARPRPSALRLRSPRAHGPGRGREARRPREAVPLRREGAGRTRLRREAPPGDQRGPSGLWQSG